MDDNDDIHCYSNNHTLPNIQIEGGDEVNI
jgi:hypothetical protein